jgi:hypothetical protein
VWQTVDVLVPHYRISSEKYASANILPFDIFFPIFIKQKRGGAGRLEFPGTLCENLNRNMDPH